MTKKDIINYVFNESIDRSNGEMIKPRYEYYVQRYRTALDPAEIQDVCVQAITYLMDKYDSVNKSLIGMTINNKILNRIKTNKNRKKKEVYTLDINDKHGRAKHTTIAAEQEKPNIDIQWKEPLTEKEQLYVDLVSKGVLSNVITKEYKIPVKEQNALKNALKRKIIIKEEQ